MKTFIKNFKLNEKTLDIFCYVFCVIYLLFVILFAINDVTIQNNINREIQNMLLHANAVNKKIEDNKFYNSSQEDDEIISTEPLFTDGKTALLSAYNKTVNSNSFYGEAVGSMSTTTMGITVKVSSFTQVIKYSPTKCYENRANILLETNAPSSLMGMINDLANSGVKRQKENNMIKQYRTGKVYYENNLPVSNYKNSTIQNNVKAPMIAESLYIINEETIQEITYFKIKYKKGVPSEYYVQAVLDPVGSTVNYKQIIREGAKVSSDPVYQSVVVTVIINAKGYVTNVTSIDKCTIEKMGTCPCVMTQTYTIGGFDEEMTFIDKDFL